MFRKYLPELKKRSQDVMRPMSIADMMEDFWKNSFDFGPFKSQGYPVVDISETDKAVEVKAELPGVDAKALKAVWSTLASGGVDVGVLVGEQGDKAPVLTAVGDKGLAAGLDARQLLTAVTAVLGGGGGGKPAMAQGQGQDRSRIDAALAAANEAVRAAASA